MREWRPPGHLLQSPSSKSAQPPYKRWGTSSDVNCTLVTRTIQQGPHKLALLYLDFLHTEMAEMIECNQWLVLPFELVKGLPNLYISPLGIVPQQDQRPWTIVKYSFSRVNNETVALALHKSMQFGHTLQWLLEDIVNANPKFGPVYMCKVDIACRWILPSLSMTGRHPKTRYCLSIWRPSLKVGSISAQHASNGMDFLLLCCLWNHCQCHQCALAHQNTDWKQLPIRFLVHHCLAQMILCIPWTRRQMATQMPDRWQKQMSTWTTFAS